MKASRPRTIRSILLVTITFLIVAMSSPPTSAAILDINGSGQLTGASGVTIPTLGTFDVEFRDDTCSAIFSGCDAVTDFDFQTQAAAILAAQALLDMVLIDDSGNLFDSNPELTQGCNLITVCSIVIPFGIGGGPNARTAINRAPGLIADIVGQDNVTATTDLSGNGPGARNATFAKFTPTPVPIPNSSLLFATGLFSLAGYRWRQRRRTQRQVR